MSVRAAFVLGILLVAAALLHGGIYTAGHDFVLNRFTGWYEFVPDEGGARCEDDPGSVRGCAVGFRTLTSSDSPSTVVGLQHRR